MRPVRFQFAVLSLLSFFILTSLSFASSIYVNENGNVGIQTTASDANKLHVYGHNGTDKKNYGLIMVENTGDDGGLIAKYQRWN